MYLVCKSENEAKIYNIEGTDAYEIGTIADMTPDWAIEEGDETQIDWLCCFDTNNNYCHGETLDECIERFVSKATRGYDEPEVFDGTIRTYIALNIVNNKNEEVFGGYGDAPEDFWADCVDYMAFIDRTNKTLCIPSLGRAAELVPCDEDEEGDFCATFEDGLTAILTEKPDFETRRAIAESGSWYLLAEWCNYDNGGSAWFEIDWK